MAKIKDTVFGRAQFGKSPFFGEQAEESLRGVAISITAKFSYAAQFSEKGPMAAGVAAKAEFGAGFAEKDVLAASVAPTAIMAAEIEGL